ncbi:trypsin-like peptidase domain-containing protein [Parafilimonas sp.]|uniref:trypsin-like peptidase domain-containing protein n=1 Tax=Parafilimonas sp. TaxID=1969739 RepID=UPI0039E3A09B
MKLKNVFLVIAISIATSLLSIWGYGKWMSSHATTIQNDGKIPVNYAGFFDKNAPTGIPDFTDAATSATPAVVHIKTKIKGKTVSSKSRNPFGDMFGDDDPFYQFFGGPRSYSTPDQQASGSGVIMSKDGYIITNNHVVDGASEINVTLSNRKSYKATVVGTDPNTDIAVIKIDADNLPYMMLGNSDDVKLGQWVMAVGYPLNLDVTVTAGIVSAKARSIGINQSDRAIESFIQTDAAVNPGNSGGALINTSGELIGINSAIASPTGSYAGYSYAIPVNIVKKAVNDLIKFGAVQRAYVGIQMGDKDGPGVYVNSVADGGSAQAAGIKPGDFITKVNGVGVNSAPEIQDQVSRYKPGDKVTITYIRSGKENTVSLTLKNKSGNYDVVKNSSTFDALGGSLVTIDKETAKKNDISGGVQVQKLGNGVLKNTRIQEGFIITSIDGQEINSVDDLKAVLNNSNGTVRLEGVYPGYDGTYGYPLTLNSDSSSNNNNGSNP